MATPPNVVIILTDQQRLDTLAAHGSAFGAATPNLDWLYRQGVFFTNCYCTAPICAASRATLVTGLYPSQTGLYANLGNPCGPLNEGITTLAHRLQAAGWETAYHGKSHLGGDLRHYGFETALENSYDAVTATEAARFHRNRDWIVERRPYFQMVSFINPHDIYFFDTEEEAEPTLPAWANADDDLAKKPWPQLGARAEWSPRRWEAYRRFYGRCIGEVDTCIGELVAQMIRGGRAPDTWLIVTTDHGDMAGEHGLPFKGPYMYDGVTRVPLLVVPPLTRFTGKGKGEVGGPAFAGRVCDDLVSLVDIVPTVLDLAGLPAAAELPGRSLAPAARGGGHTPREAVFAEWHQMGKMVTPIRMIRSGRWKYNLHLGHAAELYDLQADPHEMNNLAGQGVGAEKELHAQVLAHIERTGDKFWSYVPTDREGKAFESVPRGRRICD